MIIDYIFLFLGIAWVTFIPGYVFMESLFGKLPRLYKFPLYLLMSVILSTYISYFAMMLFGFHRVLLLFLAFLSLIWFAVVVFKKKFRVLPRKHLGIVLLALLVYTVFFVCLYAGIFQFKDGNFVMAGPNWQDTAMHLSIIETIANGNWPPQAPYFAGAPLSYYYFVDFQAAIVNALFGRFFPQILVFLNPFFAGVFVMSVYTLAYTVTKNKKVGWLAAVLAVFYGNLGFTNFLRELFTGPEGYRFWPRAYSLLSGKGYGLEYGEILQVVPMADYFLQNRPMMFALPVLALTVALLIYALKKKQPKTILLVGVLVGSLIKFQIFGLIVSGLAAGLVFLFWSGHLKLKKFLLFVSIFLLVVLAFICLSGSQSVAGRSFVELFKETLVWGPWEKHEFLWYPRFFFLNFGFYLPLFLSSIFFIWLGRKGKKDTLRLREKLSLYVLGLILLTLPFVMRFTVYEGDMLKFFYFFVVPASILTAEVLIRLFEFKRLKVPSFFFLILVLLVSSATSATTLLWSYFNKNTGYTQSEYLAGLWIRENTPQKSVFFALPTVHSAVAEIGGRLRVISYITWPYSHGFNVGEDNVFSRRDDMDFLYQSPDWQTIQNLSQKYQAKYIYYGHEEKSNFPKAGLLLDQENAVKKIYNAAGIAIYEIL